MIQQNVSPSLRFRKFKEDWGQLVFGSFITSRVEYPKLDSNFPLYSLTIENGVTPKSARYERSHLVKSGDKAYKVVYPGDFVSNPMNLRFGAIAKHHGTENVLVSKYYDVFHVDSSVVANFIEMYFSTHRTLGFYNSLATGTLDEKKRVHFSDFVTFKRLFPSFKEQQKIAEYLSTVDKKISLLKEKHALLEQYKKGVMQKLFSQEIRFKDENGTDFPDWKQSKLGEHLVEYKERSQKENEHEVLTSSRTGLMKQSDYYSEGRITERSNKGFNVIPENHITFRSRSDDRKFFFNLNTLGLTGIISTYYPVFKMKNEQNGFFIELTRYHKNVFGKYAVGTSQVVLSTTEFLKIKLEFPCSEEQRKISDFAKELDKKLELVSQQIEQTQTFKKGLLQQMFV